MKKQDFNFDLPHHLIAQTPLSDRTQSKMMVINRQQESIDHQHFYDITHLFKNGDVLILNDTKVIPARMFGHKVDTNAHVEILLLKEVEKDTWETLVGNAKAVKLGSVINIADKLFLHCIEILERGRRVFKLEYTGNLYELLIEIGEIPLPPYIKEQLADDDRYQTVYAKYQGSAAAPTAGLHFTEAILESLKAMGVHVHTITLHVGLGTFLPMQADDVLDHNMHSEHYIMSEATADALNLAKADGRRIIAVGSTSLRTLETNYKMFNGFQAYEGDTNIFIYPGIPVLSTDILITNFHLPESTLMMLISAFGGYDLMMSAYQSAIDHEYRFFSFGDMMWIG